MPRKKQQDKQADAADEEKGAEAKPCGTEKGQAAMAPVPTVEEVLRKELDEARKKADENLQKLLLVAADYDNFRKFTDRERKEALTKERAWLLVQFLGVVENIERALEAGRKGLPADSPLLKGMQMTLDGARELLKREGVQPIESLGKQFDTAFHEAVCFVPDQVKPEYLIVEEVQRGYMLESRVLRPSKVAVVTRPPAPCGADARSDDSPKPDDKSKDDKEKATDDKDKSKISK